MAIKNAIFIIGFSIFLSGCGPEELQEFDYYLLNPDALNDALAFCEKSTAQKHAGYCKKIAEINVRYQGVEQEYKNQRNLYNEYSTFYPDIQDQAQKALEDAKRLVKLKRKGLRKQS